MSAITMTEDAVRLAQEAEELRERLARKEDDPHARLAEIETKLEAHWDAQHERRVEAEQEFERVLAEYEPAREGADAAVEALVEKVTRARDLRKQLEAARKKAGVPAPPTISVRASRDRKLATLRQNARLAAGASY